MPRILSKQQVEQYRELGYVSPIDVMSPDEAGRYRQRFEAAELAYPNEIHGKKRNNAHLVLTCLDELVHHPIIVGAVADLIGEDIALWGTVLFIKEPASKGYVSWHQDGTYMGMNSNEFVTPWLALTPSNRENGCMTVIPGSQRDAIQPHRDTFEEDNILTRGQVVENVDPADGVDLILEAGQMSLHHGALIHASQPNLSDARRIGFAMQSYMPPDVHQLVSKNMWLPIRGENDRPGMIALDRPTVDMTPEAVAQRELANENYAAVLYAGAEKRRSY